MGSHGAMVHSAFKANPSLDPGQPATALARDHRLIESVEAVWDDPRGHPRDRLQRVARETQMAGESLTSFVVYGIVVGMLAVSAWLGVAGAMVLWL